MLKRYALACLLGFAGLPLAHASDRAKRFDDTPHGLVARAAGASAPQADAQGEPPRVRADRLFVEATAAYEAGSYAEAARMYAAANAIIASARALYNSARAWQQASELTRAADAYAEALTLPDLDSARAADARRQLQILRRGLAQVHVEAAQPGTVHAAHLSGAPLPVVVHLWPGQHEVEVRMQSGHTTRRVIEVEAGQKLVITFDVHAVPGQERVRVERVEVPGQWDPHFFARLGLGVGLLSDSITSTASGKAELAGASGGLDMAIGASLTPRLALALSFMVDSIRKSDVTFQGTGPFNDLSVGALITWGALLDYSPWEDRGWHVMTSVGAAHLQLKDASNEELSHRPIGAYLMVGGGYGWKLWRHLRAGTMARIAAVSMRDDGFNHGVWTVSALASLSWDARGYGQP